jgi:hypothetical protein
LEQAVLVQQILLMGLRVAQQFMEWYLQVEEVVEVMIIP